MDLLTLRAAGGGGTIDGHDAAGLVAAGFTLLQRSATLVRALAGKRSAILLPTSPQFLVALAASEGRGAVLINPLAAPAEIVHQLADADVGAVFTFTALATRLPPGTAHVLLDDAPARARVVTAGGVSDVDLGSHFGLSLEGDAGAPGRDEECAIVYTSAMAGTPLGAILTHRNLIANARQCAESAETTREDHVLAVLPFSHLFGLTVSAMAPLISGARVTTMARFNPLAAVDLMEREGITAIVGVPAVFGAMLAAIERRGGQLARGPLRLCMSGGAVLAEELQERWADLTGVELRQGYGLTEASPVALFNDLRQPNRRGALGTALPGVRVSVRDPLLNTPLDDGTEGELCVAGETVFAEYVQGGEAGLQVHDGWLHTGDLAVRDADGVYTFRGVRKRMFTRNGFNVYPAELERVFRAMPGVRQVHVEGVMETATEHEVHVTLHGPVTESDATAWGAERLAAYKRPTHLSIRPQD